MKQGFNIFILYAVVLLLIIWVCQNKRTENFQEDSELVSVIIPTYNRLKYVLNTIRSVKEQTYRNVEIIVVNDRSTDEEYYTYDFEGVNIIHLEKNSKEIFGYACAGYVRNQGVKIARGKYIAFCDDDDSWLSNKLELQIAAMKESGCKMSSTEAYTGHGTFNEAGVYKLYLSDFSHDHIKQKFDEAGSKLIENVLPRILTLDMLKIVNCIITSSVVIHMDLLNRIGNFKTIKNAEEDYDCWLRALEHTCCAYVETPSMYYDLGHGDGRNY